MFYLSEGYDEMEQFLGRKRRRLNPIDYTPKNKKLKWGFIKEFVDLSENQTRPTPTSDIFSRPVQLVSIREPLAVNVNRQTSQKGIPSFEEKQASSYESNSNNYFAYLSKSEPSTQSNRNSYSFNSCGEYNFKKLAEFIYNIYSDPIVSNQFETLPI